MVRIKLINRAQRLNLNPGQLTQALRPDLFMQRVAQDGDWTLFSPDETSDLHDRYGLDFKTAY